MRQKIFLMLALLCAVVQGAWSQNYDVWDGVTKTRPTLINGWYQINSASNLAYLNDVWGKVTWNDDYSDPWSDRNYVLNVNLDMTAASWSPIGSQEDKSNDADRFFGKFDGNGHTIKLKIRDTSSNNQALFVGLASAGKVYNLHIDADIKVGNSRFVAGIAGESRGTIENCWVSGHIESNHYSVYDADLGAIAGINEGNGTIKYCCVTADVKNTDKNSGVGGIVGSNEGTIQHVTFYGSVSVEHAQDNKYVGDQDKTLENYYDSFNQDEYDAADGNSMYRYAVRYPFAINISSAGSGTLTADSERAYPGQTVTLTKSKGVITSVNVNDADGKAITLNGNATDGYTFTMPKRDVQVTVVFDTFGWPQYGNGSESNPYLINSQLEWNSFAASVESGNSYTGEFVKLNTNISVMEMCGKSEGKPFSGTFDGGGHDINSYINNSTCEGAAPFRYISGATIKNLTVSGHLYGSTHAAGIVGYSKGTGNRIENCAVSANIYGGTHIGGILGHGLNSDITITNCVFSGRIIGGSTVGIFFGWGDDGGTKSVTNCLYLMKSGQSVVGLDLVKMNAGNVSVSDCYKTCKEGTYGIQVSATLPDNDIYKPVTAARNTLCYMVCTVNGVDKVYHQTGSVINVVPSLTAADGTDLTANTDYTYTISPGTVQERGDYTLTITSQGENYLGTKTMTFTVLGEGDAVAITSESTTLSNKSYKVFEEVTIDSRITINGNVVLILGEGATLYAKKGIELSSDNNANLTIEGPGTLTIDDCDENYSGIGAKKVGTLTINGGTINVIGGYTAAGIGGSRVNETGGTITINGGVVNATGGQWAAGIGGGYDNYQGNYGVCGDIVINGGQVTAIGDYGSNTPEAPGIGPGDEGAYYYGMTPYIDTKYNSGTLTIGWTEPTDFVYSSGYANDSGSTLTSITFAPGKEFVIANTETIATTDNIGGEMIVPYLLNSHYIYSDNDTYTQTVDMQVGNATYRKTLDSDRVGKHQAWLVPFDYTITAADLEKFNFYKINMIANSPDPSQEASDQMWVFVKKLDAGAVLHANMPYVYKPKEAVTDYAFTTENAVLKAKNTGVVMKTETAEDVYSFYASYGNTTATAQDPFYYVNIDGGISLGNDGTVTVGAFRWIIRVESKFGGSTAYARKMTFFDGESDVTGITTTNFTNYTNSDAWYTLDGRKLDGKPAAKGIYVNNGRKIVIK